ncbi:hypothetical protein P3W45_000871 [Vairimorpha bombi]|jgi:hypothetical protein
MNEKTINRFIKDRKYYKLSSLFKVYRPKYNLSNITPPFDTILNHHFIYTKERTFLASIDVLKSCYALFQEDADSHYVFKFVINNCLNELQTEDEIKSLIKILQEIYKNIYTKHWITNVLLSLYFKIKNYELAYNFLQITSNTRSNKKDFYIYNLYKGLLLLYKEDIEGSSECLRISYRCKKIRKSSFFIFFIISLISNRMLTDNQIKKYGDIRCKNIKESIQFGLISRLDEDMHNLEDVFVSYNINNICKTYLPLICFSNLIRRLFEMFNEDYKLNLNYLVECLDIQYEDIISMICSVIDCNLVKGYISINKNVMVFSKKNPFPMSFN